MTRKKSITKPAVFFDRDGVLNIDTPYVYRKQDFVWIDGAIEAIKYFNDLGYLVFVVANQSGVARGYYNEGDVNILHDWVNSELKHYNAHIDAFYYCPHHPDGTIQIYSKVCDCRKPSPGMILKAMEDWAIDRDESLMIGNKDIDVQAGLNAGLSSYLFSGDNLFAYVMEVLQDKDAASTPI